VQLGRGPIIYPTGQPFESCKHVETHTRLYVGLYIEVNKLVCTGITKTQNSQIPQIKERDDEKRRCEGTTAMGEPFLWVYDMISTALSCRVRYSKYWSIPENIKT
jgi:hypothetical protein